jgi:hypothetical protein
MRQCLWTAATNGPTIHLPGDIRAWRTTVRWYRQGKTPNSSTRASWQSYQQSPLIEKQEELAKEIIDFCLRLSYCADLAIGQVDQGFPRFFSVLGTQIPCCTACFSCSPPDINIKFSPSVPPPYKIKISPYAAFPRYNVWIRGSNWVQWNPVQLFSLLHLSSLPSSQPNVLPSLQPTFTRRTNGHCLGTFIAVKLSVSPLLNVVSRTTHPFSLLCLSSASKGWYTSYKPTVINVTTIQTLFIRLIH